MRRDQILPQQRIIGRPFCEVCKSQMWLACIEPYDPDHKRTFECPACPNMTVRIVKYRSHAKLQGIKIRPSGDRAALYKTGSPGASGVRGRVSQLFSRRSASSARASQAWATLKRVSLSFAFIFSAIRTQSR